MKDLVLTFNWYKADNWYGKNYRVLLSSEENIGFKTRKEAKKYQTDLKKYIHKKYNIKVSCKKMIIGERKEFKSFIYCANGPSQDWTHFNITIKDLKD